MKDPIDVLMDEHRTIEQALAALESYATRVGGDGADKADLAAFVEFIRLFADNLHKQKEETILFAEMVKHGFPDRQGPIAVMLTEHDEGRRLTGIMAAVSQQPLPWTVDDRSQAATAAFGYTRLLAQHIQKEDGILYPMARTHLPAETLDRIAEQFAAIDAAQQSERERLIALAGHLAEKYGSADLPRPPLSACCGGH